MEKPSVNLTAIYVEEENRGGFTAFFAQFPNIIAEGDTQEEATRNLFHLVGEVFEYQKNQELQEKKVKEILHVTTKSFNLQLA